MNMKNEIALGLWNSEIYGWKGYLFAIPNISLCCPNCFVIQFITFTSSRCTKSSWCKQAQLSTCAQKPHLLVQIWSIANSQTFPSFQDVLKTSSKNNFVFKDVLKTKFTGFNKSISAGFEAHPRRTQDALIRID